MPTTPLSELFGLLQRRGIQSTSIEDMERAIAEGASSRFGKSVKTSRSSLSQLIPSSEAAIGTQAKESEG